MKLVKVGVGVVPMVVIFTSELHYGTSYGSSSQSLNQIGISWVKCKAPPGDDRIELWMLNTSVGFHDIKLENVEGRW